MNAFRFHAWTRRRFGTAAASAIAGVFGLAAGNAARARKKRRKKKRKRKCEKLGTRCNPRNDKQVCCSPLYCQKSAELGGNRCCKPRYESCLRDADCCPNMTCVGGVNRLCETRS